MSVNQPVSMSAALENAVLGLSGEDHGQSFLKKDF